MTAPQQVTYNLVFEVAVRTTSAEPVSRRKVNTPEEAAALVGEACRNMPSWAWVQVRRVEIRA